MGDDYIEQMKDISKNSEITTDKKRMGIDFTVKKK